MIEYAKIKFEFPLQLSEKKEKEGKFIFEGFAAANDFDLQNDIISDEALRKCISDFKKEGKFCINHTEETIGKLIDCHFKKGKIWVKTEVTKKSIIKKVKSGELNCLSIKGQILKAEKVELLPDLRIMLIKELHLIEVSLVPQGANPEAKAIRWYVSKAIKMAEADKNMKNKEIKEIDLSEGGESEETTEEETTEEATEEATEEETPVEEEAPTEETPEETSEETPEEEKKEETELTEEKIVYSVMNSGAIDLEDKKEFSEFKKELLRVGKWQHNASRTGVLDVTKEMLKTIVKNFKSKVIDNVFVPLGHPTTDDPSKNVGQVADLKLSKDGDKLMATIDVKDETIAEKIKKGLIKGISASFAENYFRKDTSKSVGPTLFHAALVNEPYIKGLESFVPLSDDFKDSIVIPIMNIDVHLTLSQMAEKIQKLEEKVSLNEDNETSEETSEEVTSEETPKEETPERESTEETPTEEETSTEEDSKKSESPEVGKETEDGEEEETEEASTEETETEETETEEETEEAKAKKERVELAEAEKIFEELLKQGQVTPAEKDLLLPLLQSDTPIELADGRKVDIRKALKKYLESRSPIFSLEEFGTIEGNKKDEEKIPEEVKEQMDNMGFSEDIQKDTYKDFKKNKEGKGKKEESTLF